MALATAFVVVFAGGVGVGVYHWPASSALRTGAAAPDPNSHTYPPVYRSEGAAYTLKTSRLSYFALDANGGLELRESLPHRSEATYRFDRTIDPNRTAIVVMDPWRDMADEHLNEYYGKVTESHIVPLVERALTRGHPIIVLTNDPARVKYNTRIHPDLQALVEDGKASLLFHQDLGRDGFAAYLHSQEITSLVYVGFASNTCVIGRRSGMIPMTHRGFTVFFVPEASAAVEYPDSWHDQSGHKATTKIISQWIAEIIDYDEFMKASIGQ